MYEQKSWELNMCGHWNMSWAEGISLMSHRAMLFEYKNWVEKRTELGFYLLLGKFHLFRVDKLSFDILICDVSTYIESSHLFSISILSYRYPLDWGLCKLNDIF